MFKYSRSPLFTSQASLLRKLLDNILSQNGRTKQETRRKEIQEMGCHPRERWRGLQDAYAPRPWGANSFQLLYVEAAQKALGKRSVDAQISRISNIFE